jgi:hypothetical protein
MVLSLRNLLIYLTYSANFLQISALFHVDPVACIRNSHTIKVERKTMSGNNARVIGAIGEGSVGMALINSIKHNGLKLSSLVDDTPFKRDLALANHNNIDHTFAINNGAMLGAKTIEDIITYCKVNNINTKGVEFLVSDTSKVDVRFETKDVEVTILKNGEVVKNFPISLKMKTSSGNVIYSKGSASNIIFFEKICKGTNLLTNEVLNVIDESELKEGFKPFYESHNKSYSKANKAYNEVLGFNWKHERKNLLANGLKMVVANATKEELNILGKNLLKMVGFSDTYYGLVLRKGKAIDASTTILTTINNKIWNKMANEDVESVEVDINEKSTLKIRVNGVEFGTDYNAATFCMAFNPYKVFSL